MVQTIQSTLNSIAAHLYVRDLRASTDFFTKLQVRRDKALLALRSMDESFFAENIRQREGLLSASITLATAEEIDQLYLTYQAEDVSIAQPLRTEPWQAQTFVIRDPDGNLILFAGPAD